MLNYGRKEAGRQQAKQGRAEGSVDIQGVRTGGIVSTVLCLLYKFFTLKLASKQVMGLITHRDSPHIRAIGFMYIDAQPPAALWDGLNPS